MIEHTIRKHARLSASRADRFMSCPGSYLLEEKMPYEQSGPAAAIGTAIHELSERILRGESIQAGTDPDHLDMAQNYANFVDSLVENPRKRMIEVNVDAGLKSLHHALGGTADAVLVDGDHLHVIDLKTGRVLVEAEDNKQLLTYALGVMRQLKAPKSITCTMHIYQPKAGHSKWTVTGKHLVTHGEELLAAAKLALTDNAPTNPSTSACKYCKAKPICPSMRQKVQDNARKEFTEIVNLSAKDETIQVPPVTPDMIELAQLAAAWSEAVLDAAKRQITEGATIQGWALKPGRKTRFWKSDALAFEALKSYPQAFDLKSPSAIAKLDIQISADLIGEKHAASSLAKSKD
jgi:RecB family exonuclease